MSVCLSVCLGVITHGSGRTSAEMLRLLLLLGFSVHSAAANVHTHQHTDRAHHQQAQHFRQPRHERNLSASLHNHTALPTWAAHLPRLLVERRRVTELNRLTLICVLSMGALISIAAMAVIVQARRPPLTCHMPVPMPVLTATLCL